MKKLVYLLPFAVVLTSCGGDATVNDTASDSTKTDSTAVLNPNISIDLAGLLAKFPASTALPFEQDSAYLVDQTMEDSFKLTGDEAKYLSYNFVESDILFSGKTTIDDVVFFDSLKLSGGYDGYVEVLDLGMMKDANAYAAERLKLDDSTELLMWYIDFGTYEACPYFSGKYLYASIFRNNQITSCIAIGEDSGGGDAPYWSETTTLCAITSGKISATRVDRNGGETDEEGNDMVSESTTTFTIQIVNGQWEVSADAAAEL